MKSPLLIIIVGGALCASAITQGQSPAIEKIPFPQGPIPANAPNLAKWTLTVTEKTDGAATSSTASHPAKGEQVEKEVKTVVTVVKTLPVRCVTIASSRGETSTIWCVDEFQAHQDQTHKNPTLFTGGSLVYISFSQSDFPELGWVSEKNFVGVRSVGERQYLMFNEKLANVSGAIIPNQGDLRQGQASDSSRPDMVDSMAAIDAQTRLPVSMRKGPRAYVYTFQEPPTSVLPLPENIKSMVEAEKQRLNALTRKSPKR